MFCYNCGCLLSEKDFCTGCGADVSLYKRIMSTANRFYNEALEKASIRDLSGAVASLRQCLKLNKNHIDARNLLGLVYFERGEVVAALSEWIMSKNIRSEKNIADDYIDMLQNNPTMIDGFNQTAKKFNLALSYCYQDSLDLAVIQLKKIVSMNPKFVQARQLLALLYMNNGEWERAKRELDRAQSIDINNVLTLRYLKEVEEMMPTEEEHVKKRKNAVVYQSGNDTVIQPVGKKDTIGIQTLVNIVVGVAIGICITWFLIVPAKVQEVQNQANEQYRTISEQIDAKNVQVNELTAQIESLIEERDSLSVDLSEAQKNETLLAANTNLIEAVLMNMNGRGNEMAIADTLELITEDYLETQATDSFKNLYNALKNSIGPTVARNCYNIGYEAYRAQDYDTAIVNLERAVQYDATHGEALYNLGNSYNKKGETDKALEIYEQVVELFPGTEKARRSRTYINEIKGE